MAKRFNNLDAALKYLRTNTGGLAPDAPAGSFLRTYQDWKAGKRAVSYTRDVGSKPGDLKIVAINPFALPADEDNLALVTLSARARASTFGTGMIAAGGITEIPPVTATKLKRFVPAKATIFVPGTGTGKEPSKLTGVSYEKKGGTSYTFPYGAESATSKEAGIRKIITALVVQSNVRNSVSFSSEKY